LSEDSGRGAGRWRAHGGLSEEERRRAGVGDAPVLDFSVNVNPYGPTPAMLAAVRGAVLGQYPDDGACLAREALGQLWAVEPDQIVLGNGAAELLWLCARVVAPPGTRVLIVGPTFSEFAAGATSNGAAVNTWRATADDDFCVDVSMLCQAITATAAEVVYLCAPNNPTGVHLKAAELQALAQQNHAVTFVVDQAFLSLCEHAAEIVAPRPPNVLFVRSLTKDHAIPGLRVGAVVASPALAARLELSRPSWSTSAGAQAAAVAARHESDFVAECRRKLIDDRRALAAALATLGLACVPSSTTFVLAGLPGAVTGHELRDRLLGRFHILVRDCASFGLPDFIRVAARPEADRRALLAALAATLRG
jgi:histidinol-phosphate/aromatic aminotransferase/cobyric acid decarboxylase-like protein